MERIRQHRKGEPFLVSGKNKEIVMTLREIASGKVTFDNVQTLPDRSEQAKSDDQQESEVVSDLS